jgi:hypothetical protein
MKDIKDCFGLQSMEMSAISEGVKEECVVVDLCSAEWESFFKKGMSSVSRDENTNEITGRKSMKVNGKRGNLTVTKTTKTEYGSMTITHRVTKRKREIKEAIKASKEGKKVKMSGVLSLIKW